MKKYSEFIADITEAAIFYDSQKDMHKTLKKHGWSLAAKNAHKTNGAIPDHKREEEGIRKLGARSTEEVIAHMKKAKYYTHPDRPGESIKTSPGGHQYNVWAHNKYDEVGGWRGTRGKSGPAAHLAHHLESGAKPY